MKRCGKITISLVFAALICCSALPSSGAQTKQSPIQVEADHMSSTEKTSTVLFTGDVDAKQDDVRIRSDEMTVFYTEKDKNIDQGDLPNQVEKMVCVGNVEITRNKWLGTSKRMIYLAKERQFILIGNAKAWQDQNMVSGDKIIYYLDEGRSEVVAEATADAGGKKGKKDKKPGRVNMTILQQ